jgi:heme-degrading monooxygenase HmoA
MLIKWILCKVSEDTREAFSQSQANWTRLKTVDGFLGQVGGWNRNEPLEACIVAFWRDQQAFDEFMKFHHDSIVEGNGQQGTFHALSVILYEGVFEIAGSAVSLQEALSSGELLRVAENVLYEGRDEHFIEQQQRVWNPGMQTYTGMLGGAFGRKCGEDVRYLVLTVRQDEAAHHEYAETAVASLRAQAQVDMDVESLVGRLVLLESRWTVLP